jgi:hypothetical protein
VRTTRIVLFSLLAATLLAGVALFVTSTVERGPANVFTLVAQPGVTTGQLESDAAAMVRRLQSLGYANTQARVQGHSVEVTVYGAEAQVREALLGAVAQGRLYVRPVECTAPPAKNGGVESQLTGVPLECAPRYRLTAAALKVDTTTALATGSTAPDPALSALRSTAASADEPAHTVLLPAGANSGFRGMRLVCGPAAFGNSGVSSAGTVSEGPKGSEWSVQVTLTTAGAKAYDTFAQRQFHALIAIDIDGTVVSAPLVEPTETSYSSFGGTLEFSAGLSKSQAVALADDLTSPLSVPLQLSG